MNVLIPRFESNCWCLDFSLLWELLTAHCPIMASVVYDKRKLFRDIERKHRAPMTTDGKLKIRNHENTYHRRNDNFLPRKIAAVTYYYFKSIYDKLGIINGIH